MSKQTYFQKHTQAELSSKLGITQGNLSKLANGKIRPSVADAIAIHQLTKGEWSKYEIRPDFFGDKREKR